MTEKRDLFAEIMEGIESMRQHRQSKIALRTHIVEAAVAPTPIDAQTIRETREQHKLSRKAFARRLRISPRTLER